MSDTPLQGQVSQSNRVADENILAVARLQDQAADVSQLAEQVEKRAVR